MATEKMTLEEQRALWCVCDTIENAQCNYCEQCWCERCVAEMN